MPTLLAIRTPVIVRPIRGRTWVFSVLSQPSTRTRHMSDIEETGRFKQQFIIHMNVHNVWRVRPNALPVTAYDQHSDAFPCGDRGKCVDTQKNNDYFSQVCLLQMLPSLMRYEIEPIFLEIFAEDNTMGRAPQKTKDLFKHHCGPV